MEQLVLDIERHLPDGIKVISTSLVPGNISHPDSTTKLILRTSDGNKFAIVSSPIAPSTIQQAVEMQKQTQFRLQGLAAEAIELPLFEGDSEGRSFAVWSLRKPLASGYWARFEKMVVARKVYRWLRAVAAQTCRSIDEARLVTDLDDLLNTEELSSELKAAAVTAKQRLQAQRLPAICVIQHGDLWLGNVLRKYSKPGFIVIDWGGARIDGAPFCDLLRFAISAGASDFRLRREIAAHSMVLRCKPEDAVAYILCGLGALSANLRYFPRNTFIELCNLEFNKIRALTSSG